MSHNPALGIVAGSGLDLRELLDFIDEERAFTEVPGLDAAPTPGHAGRFIRGTCAGIPVVLQLGRLHFYEGHDYAQVTRPVDIMRDFGADSVIFTNAAGGLDPPMKPGDLMAVERIRLWPYRRWPSQPEALETDFSLTHCDWTGDYYWVHGPCYETRAEVRALHALRGNAVGMSTAAELHRAQTLGMRAAAVSCITNNCWTPNVLTHEHVLKAAKAASSRLSTLLRAAIAPNSGAEKHHSLNTNAEKR